jgi:hypothetical protein
MRDRLSRRTFYSCVGLLLGTLIPENARDIFAAQNLFVDVATIDRARILRAANNYLSEPPITITQYAASRSAGGKHDYFSEGDY